ncbi:MAG: glycoside hydrolase family 26 protein [Bacteroidales bacterium]
MLPGAGYHAEYREMLNNIGEFNEQLKEYSGDYIPMIFRPFHEHIGRWFWWGKGHATREEFISLWQFTVNYLRDSLDVHNFIYAYSPDTVANKEQYLEWYPGDEYVDLLGIDIYRDVKANNPRKYIHRLELVADIANERGKPWALTETGYSFHEDTAWWTNFLLKCINHSELTRSMSYFMLWANYRKDMYFSIYPGHPSQDNFLEFSSHSLVKFAPGKDL